MPCLLCPRTRRMSSLPGDAACTSWRRCFSGINRLFANARSQRFNMIKKIFLIIGLFVALAADAQTDAKGLPFWDYKLPFEQRVDDLVSRMTLEEKVAQMLNHAPAIERLGIPAYDWWNAVLHGVARTPFKTTV